jgi:hypothetical protein
MIERIFNKNNLKLLIPLFFVLFLIFGFFIIKGLNNEGIKVKGGELPEESLVLLSDGGFAPKEITIKTGMAVRWRNGMNTEASINSDNYPTNRLYPELNLGRFKTGQTLVHIFTKAGTYTYHNQMNKDQTGTVIVK